MVGGAVLAAGYDRWSGGTPSLAAFRSGAARRRALEGAVHRELGGPGEATCGAGSPSTSGAGWRPRSCLRPGAQRARRAVVAIEVRGGQSASRETRRVCACTAPGRPDRRPVRRPSRRRRRGRHAARRADRPIRSRPTTNSTHLRRRSSPGLAARPGPVCVRRRAGATVSRTRVSGVPSRDAVRTGWRRERREHRAEMPRSQSVRSGPVLRNWVWTQLRTGLTLIQSGVDGELTGVWLGSARCCGAESAPRETAALDGSLRYSPVPTPRRAIHAAPCATRHASRRASPRRRYFLYFAW